MKNKELINLNWTSEKDLSSKAATAMFGKDKSKDRDHPGCYACCCCCCWSSNKKGSKK